MLTSSRDARAYGRRLTNGHALGFIPKERISGAAIRALVDRAMTLRLVLADDSVLVREGVARLLADAGFEVVAQVGDADALLRATREHLPDVAIVDIRMPPTHTDEGLRAAEAIRAEHGTAVGILVLSQHVEPSFALRLVSDGAGGVGYLLKDRITDLDDFADAIRRIAKGGSVIDPAVVAVLVGRRARVPLDDLTEREREVLALMAEGRSNQAIGDRLSMARKTVEAHIANIFSKLELPPASDDHRRVLAVLAHLRGPGCSRNPAPSRRGTSQVVGVCNVGSLPIVDPVSIEGFVRHSVAIGNSRNDGLAGE